MARKLASVQIITALHPIEGADRIELADVLGWHVVVKKGDVKVGDHVVYFEIDSILPYQKYEEFAFLEKTKGRIKTQKLRGVYSQGLVIPFNQLPEFMEERYYATGIGWDNLCEPGKDLTEELGVTKWDPEAELTPSMMKQKGGGKAFPSWVTKTDETRLQNVWPEYQQVKAGIETCRAEAKAQHPEWTEEQLENHLKRVVYSVTEKVDGTSCTIAVTRKGNSKISWYERLWRWILSLCGVKGSSIAWKYIRQVCSRNLVVSDGTDNSTAGGFYDTVNQKYGNVVNKIMNFMELHPEYKWVAIQGEILGPGIQKNKYKLKGCIWKVFNVQYEKTDGTLVRHASWYELIAFTNAFGLEHVDRLPDVEDKLFGNNITSIDDVVALSEGDSVLQPGQTREGIVVRFYPEDISWKCISPKFLVKNDA